MGKFILLTRVYQELTKEAEAKLDAVNERAHKAAKSIGKDLTDENGHNAEWYKNLGIDIPEYLYDREDGEQIIYEETVDLSESDYKEIKTKFLCNVEEVKYFDEVKKGTLIMYDIDTMVVVEENIEEINEKLAQ